MPLWSSLLRSARVSFPGLENPCLQPACNHSPCGETPITLSRCSWLILSNAPARSASRIHTRLDFPRRVLNNDYRVMAAAARPEPIRSGLEPGLPLGFQRITDPSLVHLSRITGIPSGRIFVLSLAFGIYTAGPGKADASPSPDLSSGLMAGAEGRLAPFVVAILASGYDNGPAAGPGSRGFHRPRGFSFLDRRDGSGWSGCLRERVDRCHAAVIASAHGQVAWIFRRRFRAPRTRRAAACSTR